MMIFDKVFGDVNNYPYEVMSPKVVQGYQMSNEKEKRSWLFRVYRGWNPAQLCGNFKKSL